MNNALFYTFIAAGISKLIYCIVIIVVSFIAIKVSSKLIRSFFGTRLTLLSVDTNKVATLSALLCSIIRYVILFVAGCSILIYLGVPTATLTAVLGTGTVAIGLAAQGIIKDIITGFFILSENQFSVGDIVTIEGNTGVVEGITVRTTILRGFDGTLHIIPNGHITIVSNMCKDYMNAIINVNVAYKENIENVIKILNDEMATAKSEIKELKSQPSVVGVVDLAPNGVTIRIVAECMVKENAGVERELRLRIKNRFDREDISIPFPQTTVHIADK